MKARNGFLVVVALGAALWVFGGPSRGVQAEADADRKDCGQCHQAQVEGWNRTAHARAGVACQTCHRAETLHRKPAGASRPADLYEARMCAGCHDTEYREWEKSPHNQPVPYTPDEILPNLITDCVRCHNVAGYVEVTRSGQPFGSAKGRLEAATSPGVTCAACHDPHSGTFPALLRAGEPAKTCDNCHGGKWQNLVLTGTGGQRYPGSTYDSAARSPHDTGDRCVTCHLARTAGVAAGGHTLRMRDQAGALNLGPCLPCHQAAQDFDVGGKQAEIRALLISLEEALKARNQGELPRFQPGKCNQCHRGGTEPFKKDPDGRLEQAFQNYRLFLNDRSLGVHNPAYTSQLLRESLQHVLQGFSGPLPNAGDEGCCGHKGSAAVVPQPPYRSRRG